MKCLYLVTRSMDPKGTGQTRWTMRWKPALNAVVDQHRGVIVAQVVIVELLRKAGDQPAGTFDTAASCSSDHQ
jgi:hypothetical protein